MTVGEPNRPAVRVKDGRAWRIGSEDDVAWITDGTSVGRAITAAIPPVFDAYGTVELPTDWQAGQPLHDQIVVTLLSEHSGQQPWWLGYLDTGADDVVFPDAPMVSLYAGWRYVLIEAGPQEAASWRRSDTATFWKGALPNLMFPAWLISTLWDDDWTCVGGSTPLVGSFLEHPGLRGRARGVALSEDAHAARL